MSIQWPTDIPQTPLLSGYDSEKEKNRVVSNVGGGLNKLRARFMAVPVKVNEEYILTNAQKESFETWYNNDIEYGSLKFIKNNPEDASYANNPVGFNTATYRFRGDSSPSFKLEGFGKDGPIWKMSIDLEILPS